MNNLGVGCVSPPCGNDMMMLFLLIMMCPGLFGCMGENPMMLMMLMMMMCCGRF